MEVLHVTLSGELVPAVEPHRGGLGTSNDRQRGDSSSNHLAGITKVMGEAGLSPILRISTARFDPVKGRVGALFLD